jgi:acetyl esterase/lipase
VPSRHELRTEDIEFHRHGGRQLLARLYRPLGPGPFAGVVEVHGGAWTLNDRTTNEPIDRPLAASGAVVMAIDFRMPPEAQYPAALEDINLATRWLKAHAAELGVDRVGGLGTSSGGHQLMLSALRPRHPRYAGLPLPEAGGADASLAFVVLCWPVTDPLARYRMVREKGNQRLVDAHHAYWPSEAEMADGNPQLILERGEADRLPPLLLVQGTDDDNLTPDMADRFALAYAKAGGRVRLEKFAGQPHTFAVKDPMAPASVEAIRMIQGFVRQQAAAPS